VLRGLAPDGGLYMPVEIARHSPEELEEFRRLPFTEVCFRVVKPFATPDVPEEVLWQVVSEAINFPVNLVSLSPGLHILELFHGPTLAFKDFGARFMARLMGYFVRGDVVEHLWQEPADIDGVCRGQEGARVQLRVGEGLLHQPLAIVEGARHFKRGDVFAERGELLLLCFANEL